MGKGVTSSSMICSFPVKNSIMDKECEQPVRNKDVAGDMVNADQTSIDSSGVSSYDKKALPPS